MTNHETEDLRLIDIPVLEPRVEPDQRDIVYKENVRLAPECVYALNLTSIADAFLGPRVELKTPIFSVVKVLSETGASLVIQTLDKKGENPARPYRLQSAEVYLLGNTFGFSDQAFAEVEFDKEDLQEIPGIENMAMCLPFDENNFSEHVKIERFIDKLQRALIEETCNPLTLEDYAGEEQAGKNAFVRRFVSTSFLHKDAMDGAHIRLDNDSHEPEIFQALRAAGLSEVKTGKRRVANALVPWPDGFPVLDVDQSAGMSHSLSEGFYLTKKTEFSPHDNVHTNYYQLSFHKPPLIKT
ncbi:MAG: hypothetical protein HYT11_03035 [Candidatus Levybacteria bacterium]|nr:hypothetical protein [Candidatus Levybacteria bacterium]